MSHVWRWGTAGTDRLAIPGIQREEVVAVSAATHTAHGHNLGNDLVSAVLYFELFFLSHVPHSPPPELGPYITANGSLATAVRADDVERLGHEVLRIDRTTLRIDRVTFEYLRTLEDNIWWPAYNDYADTLEQRVYAMFTKAEVPFFTIPGYMRQAIRSAAKRAAHRAVLADEDREPHDIAFVNGKETIVKQADDILPYEDLDALVEEKIAEIRARNPQPGDDDDDDDNESSGESDGYLRDGGGESSSSEEERGDGGRGHSLIGGSCDVGGRGSGPSYPPDGQDRDNLYA